MVEIETHRFPSAIGGFLRMLAHFDSLDSDEEPDAPQPRYELLHPEDSFEMPNIVDYWNRRLVWTFILGEDEYLRREAALRQCRPVTG